MSHPRAPATDKLRLFVPIDPKDPWYQRFEAAWREHAQENADSIFHLWEDGPAIRELTVDLHQAQSHVEVCIRDLVKARLELLHVDKAIERDLDKRVAAAVAAAVERVGNSAVATAKAMLEKAVSAEIANNYEIVADVSIQRKANGSG